MDFNILLVEDHKDISNIIIKYLEKEGYSYALAEDGFQALELFSKDTFHLIILDIMMPGIDGFQVLKELRNISSVPVIMVTAKEQEVDRLKGFDYGADDYVVKPFSPRELMQRVNVLLKRLYNKSHKKAIEVGVFKLFVEDEVLIKNNEKIPITHTEFQIMKTFMEHEGAVLTREQLINFAFGMDYQGYDRSIDSHIKRLRQKIEDDSKKAKYIKTKYGAGYVFGGGDI